MRLIVGEGNWGGKLAVSDEMLLEEYVAYRTKMALGKVPDIVSMAIHDVLASEEWKRNVLRSITKAAATELANSRPTFAGADPHCVGAVGHKSGSLATRPIAPKRYKLEWHHECSNLRCYNAVCQLCQTCRHSCGTGPFTVQPPPVIPYASAYWVGKRGPPGPENAGKKNSAGHHVRTQCGQIVQVRLLDAETGEVETDPPPGLKLEVSLMGPYRENEEGGADGADATFACDEWTPATYHKEKAGRLKTPLADATMVAVPGKPGVWMLHENMRLQPSTSKGEMFRLGVQVVDGPTTKQPDGRAWDCLMIKSAMFEVHNLRSLSDRAPNILPQLSASSEPTEVKLLKGIGRTAAENLRRMGVHNVQDLLEASESAQLRPQLKALLRKDLECVLEQARTSLPLPNRIWRAADDHSLIVLAEHTDRLGVLEVNQPLRVVTPAACYNVSQEASRDGVPPLPLELEPLFRKLKRQAHEDWMRPGHPNWSQLNIPLPEEESPPASDKQLSRNASRRWDASASSLARLDSTTAGAPQPGASVGHWGGGGAGGVATTPHQPPQRPVVAAYSAPPSSAQGPAYSAPVSSHAKSAVMGAGTDSVLSAIQRVVRDSLASSGGAAFAPHNPAAPPPPAAAPHDSRQHELMHQARLAMMLQQNASPNGGAETATGSTTMEAMRSWMVASGHLGAGSSAAPIPASVNSGDNPGASSIRSLLQHGPATPTEVPSQNNAEQWMLSLLQMANSRGHS